MSDHKAFDITKAGDQMYDAPIKGPCMKRKSAEKSPSVQKGSSVRAQSKQAKPAVCSMQPKRGYCSLCRVHYRNLEKHLLSVQHKHFTTHNRNHVGSGTLMERFLHDVRQYHPQSYHDSRPTHDDLPYTQFLPPPREDLSDLSAGCLPKEEKETVRTKKEISTIDSDAEADSGTSSPCRTKSSFTRNSVSQLSTQTPEKGLEPRSAIPQQEMCIQRSITMCMPTDCVRTANKKSLFTAKNLLPFGSPCCPLPQKSPDEQIAAKKDPCWTVSHAITSRKLAPGNVELSDKCRPNPVEMCSVLERPSVLHVTSTGIEGSFLNLTSGLSVWKPATLKSQGELSNVQLRDIPATAFTSLEWKVGQSKSKDIEWISNQGASVDATIEEVILKHCYGILPATSSFQEEEAHSPIQLKPLLDDGYTEGSDMSFSVETPIESGVNQAGIDIKDLDFLKEAHVTLEDENYKSHLSSVLNACRADEAIEMKPNKYAHRDETVLPALPHVPPSFVGKTWSQVMYEDDLKIEALVRDFREGRFHCHFDSDSMTDAREKNNCRIKKPRLEGSAHVTSSFPDTASAKVLPTVSDDVSEAPGSLHLSVTSDTLCKPTTVRIPAKRTWRLASRCQTVKVSHGTQTSLVNYPVVKRRVIRQGSSFSDRQAVFDWQANERTPDMKTRLCALKLPESYTKILSPVQPKNMVYVLCHPDINPCRGKPAVITRSSRSHYSADSKNSVTYKYKQCPLKYYDPLTNRILRMQPSSSLRGRTKRHACVRQLFRSLSLDVNMAKLDDVRTEGISSKKSFHGSSPVVYGEEKDVNLGVKADGSSNCTESPENTLKPCRNPVLSPLNARSTTLEGTRQLLTLESRTTKASKTSVKCHLLQKKNLTVDQSGKKGETSMFKIISGPKSLKRGLGEISPRLKTQSKRRAKKKQSSFTPRPTVQTIQHRLTKHKSSEKRPNQAGSIVNTSQRVESLRKMTLRSSVNSTILESRTVASKSAPQKSAMVSSKVQQQALRTSRRTTRK
ncbi:DBF4-type zinc finger-containing protein 2 [Lissotriton helveticus]